MKIEGRVEWTLLDADGQVVQRGEGRNRVTAVGKKGYMERGAGIAGAPAVAVGMKLGTSTAGTTDTGAGAALGSYLTGSAHAFDATYPQYSLVNGAHRITFKVTYAPGEATTASAITEAVLVNDNITDITSPESATLSRILLDGITNKSSGQTLVLTWNHEGS